MRTKRNFFYTVIAIVLAASVGCNPSSGPTESTVDPAKATERVNQANQILFPRLILIAASNNPDTSAFNLSAAKSLYLEALQYNPDNLDAHLGVALTEVIALLSDASLRNIPSSVAPSLSTFPFPPVFKNGGFASVGESAKTYADVSLNFILHPITTLNEKVLMKSQASTLPSYYQNLIEAKILPVLADAIIHLQRITQNSSYAFLVTPQMLGQSSGETYRIDLTEIYLLLAVFQGINAEGSFLVSYNIDYNPVDSASVSQAWQISSPFLALRINGGQRMKDTRSNFVGMATSIKNGINFLMNEPPHQQTDIIKYNPADGPVLQSLAQSMDSVISYFTVLRTLPNGTIINVANFFDNAVSNFKAKVPAYTVSVQRNVFGTYDGVLTWQATTFDAWIFPDPTFNGFFPGMTDVGLKQTLNLTAATWNRTVIIEGA